MAPKIHRPQGTSGGDELHAESGGLIRMKSGSELRLETGMTLTDQGSTAYSAGAKRAFWLELPVLAQDTAGATAGSVTVVAPQKLTIIDALFHKTGAGSSGTTALGVSIATSTDGNIVPSVSMKGILGLLGRAVGVVPALAERASGSIIKATRTGSSGTSAAGLNVEITARVLCLPRATT
jgi:hypothetical protein